ncbi:glycosyltransferase [Chromobacterium haemolyticum]|uniref:glycosyltransferase n=1 Tax=Chromobacterium haemolyticum TaxID=394935 RepID=UPI00244AA3A2|nr:glycosyltransferase [Chromobacterium haemolyticum]MDH0344032.1 glycosyltransferase [Chromobacterium haemolyticum]
MIGQGLSVVMATYRGDHAEQLLAAGESVFNQTRVPDELVLVLDGPVELSHELVVEQISKLGTVRVLRLEKSLGPGGARHHGIVAAAHEVVAVMDADDLSVPTRFEKQLVLIYGGADVVGGWIREFDQFPGDMKAIRKVPEMHDDVWRYAKRRSPMNNVTAMFRKAKYLEAGGYTEMRTFEDYDLYVRMLLHGARFQNLPEILVEVRGGREMFKRRGGWSQIPIEAAMLYRMYRWGFLSLSEFLSNFTVRASVRVLPNWVRRLAYMLILRS